MKSKKTYKMKKRTKFVIVAIINIIWFTLACLVLSYLNREIPDSLIVAWFAAWTTELALLYGIQIKKGDDNYEDE